MILLALAKTERTRDHSSKNTQRTTIIFIRWLPSTTLLPRGETLFHFPLINILKVFKYFFGCKLALAANHQQPENIQRRFRLQNCLSRNSSISRKYSKTFRPTKAIYSSNQQSSSKQYPRSKQRSSSKQYPSRNQQSSSNQQQQSTAAINSNNQ